MSDPDASAKLIPPYCSFTTVTNLIERMEKDGVPRRIDKTYLVGMAGGTQNQVMAALRALGLTNQENRSTEILDRLAKNPHERQELWSLILQGRFGDLINVATQNSTPGELNEVLAQYGLTGATLRKAATFLVAAATYAGYEVSPHLRPARPGVSGSGTATRRPRQQRRKTPTAGTEPVVDSNGTSAPSDMKRMYFNLLIEKAKASDDPNGDLLNRIERLIGVSADDANPKD